MSSSCSLHHKVTPRACPWQLSGHYTLTGCETTQKKNLKISFQLEPVQLEKPPLPLQQTDHEGAATTLKLHLEGQPLPNLSLPSSLKVTQQLGDFVSVTSTPVLLSSVPSPSAQSQFTYKLNLVDPHCDHPAGSAIEIHWELLQNHSP